MIPFELTRNYYSMKAMMALWLHDLTCCLRSLIPPGTAEDVISWGANAEGQCGQGERAETLWVKPRSIKPLQGMYVSQVVCGKYHTMCVTATSQVRHWC